MNSPDAFPITRLMMIDDSTFDQMIYQRITSKSGLVENLLQFLDATAAIAYIADPETPNPDVILLDINMPRMDGFEFLEAATAQFGVDICPIVVMLTTSLNPKDEQRAMAFDVVRGFFSKPLTQDHLRELCEIIGATEAKVRSTG